MKKPLFLTVVLGLMLQVTSFAQSIKLNNAGDPGSAMLEVNSASKGILIPNVSLTGSTDVTTIISPAVSLLVYNTATVSDVEPGYYYNSGTSGSPVWTRLSTSTSPGPAGDGSETKVEAGTNVIVTGSGTSASPYIVNAIRAMGTSAGQIRYWNGSAWVMIEPTKNTGATLQKINGVPTWTGGYTIPDAPTIGTATAGAGHATITYGAPGSNGGAAITSYTATSFPGGITGTVTQASSGSITVMGLAAGTSYTFTVTATNAAGISSASAASNSVTPKVFDNLPSIIIDSQIWTSKNLDVSTYRDGTAIPRVVDGATWAALTTGAYCYYNNDSTTYAAIYGKLYNWYAVAGIHDNDPNTANKTLAPEGWHVPTDSEWTMLTSYLGGESVAGGKMKEVGVSHWVSPNTGATNESGFSGLPGGYRNYDGIFNSNRNNGFWWSSSEYNPTTAWYRGLSNDIGYVYRLNYYKDSGFSGRCLRD
jgi:uncharacterized protein (TIGR02145 family)